MQKLIFLIVFYIFNIKPHKSGVLCKWWLRKRIEKNDESVLDHETPAPAPISVCKSNHGNCTTRRDFISIKHFSCMF